MSGRRGAGLALAAALTLLCACQAQVQRLEPEVLARLPHDPGAFTQGLLLADGRLYESTGLYGESSLREVDPESGEVLRVRYLPAEVFGEGLARVGDRLVQLTWRSGRAFVYELDTFEPVAEFRYDTEGWGLCFDGAWLYMSDGSSRLFRRHPDTFALEGTVAVALDGEPQPRLNELECVGEHVYANVWQADTILKIHKGSGRVVAVIDAGALLSAAERAELGPDAVLNGIAYRPERDTFYLTGKLWPVLLEVRFDATP